MQALEIASVGCCVLSSIAN